MKPEASDILDIGAEQLMTQLMPNLGASYLQGAAMLHALLMKFAAREYERGADIRFQENADMRALFSELAPVVRDGELRTKLETAAAARDTSLAITALNAANRELRDLLIALHVHVEEAGARDAEKKIWRVLQAMAARRIVSIA